MLKLNCRIKLLSWRARKLGLLKLYLIEPTEEVAFVLLNVGAFYELAGFSDTFER